MPRIPLQVLVLPFRQGTDGTIEYAIFRRADYADDCWQGLAGGAEVGESAESAARREAMEEAGIAVDAPLILLDAVASVPASHFRDRYLWRPDLYVSPSEPSVCVSTIAWRSRFRASTRIIAGSHMQRLPGCSAGTAIARRCGN
jgi:8-oxo-dGTP pyrophosphatase MutT (NUDIX family)